MLSLFDHPMLPFSRAHPVDLVAPARHVARAVTARIAALPASRHRVRLKAETHALLADAHGVWSWSPQDSHAPAMRHSSVEDWIANHPGCDMRLWVAGQLVYSLAQASTATFEDDETLHSRARCGLVDEHGSDAAKWALATWRNDAARGVCALAGIDLPALTEHGRLHGVRMRSVVPWWYHAFQEAKRCVPSLNHAPHGSVCVVEGRQMAWISTVDGLLAGVRQVPVADNCIEALGEAIFRMEPRPKGQLSATVVLGHGLRDGARTRPLRATVLGRLDGEQPPQWLRPSEQIERH